MRLLHVQVTAISKKGMRLMLFLESLIASAKMVTHGALNTKNVPLRVLGKIERRPRKDVNGKVLTSR